MDPIHSVIKSVDHNRNRVIGLLIAASLMAVPACGLLQGKAVDPTTGEAATADVIYSNVTTKVDVLNGQISTLTVQRDSLVSRGSDAIDEANTKTEDNYSIASTLISNPMVAPWLASFGLGGLAVGVFEGRNSRRKDKVINKLKAPPTPATA